MKYIKDCYNSVATIPLLALITLTLDVAMHAPYLIAET